MVKNKLKYKAIRIIVTVFLLNVIFIILFCNIFLNKSIALSIDTTKDEINNNIEKIKTYLESKDTVDKQDLINISNEYDIEISLRDINDNIIYTNIEDHNFYYDNIKIITINNNEYILVVSKELDVSISSMIKSLMFIELFIILIIVSFTTFIVNKKLLRPIVYLRYDMKNYLAGIIPEKRPKEEDLYEIQNRFAELTETLEAEKQKQNEIIASVSHDIKTPLTTILGYTSRLENANLTDEVKEKYITKINNKALVIKDLMSEFDDYLGSNIEGNVHKESISSKKLFEILEQDYFEDLMDKNIKLKLHNNCKKENLVIDINKLKRVFSNIINNSIRHMNKESGLIIITLNKKDKYFEFCVSDNGEGVNKEYLNKIFDPLFTTDPSRKISGLGLSICKQIIKLHEGTIYAKNNSKNGLSIYFTIKDNKEG